MYVILAGLLLVLSIVLASVGTQLKQPLLNVIMGMMSLVFAGIAAFVFFSIGAFRGQVFPDNGLSALSPGMYSTVFAGEVDGKKLVIVTDHNKTHFVRIVEEFPPEYFFRTENDRDPYESFDG